MSDPTPCEITTQSGHRFEVTQRAGQYGVEWLTGPNKGHGFGIAGINGADLSVEELTEICEVFLAEIDPTTG